MKKVLSLLTLAALSACGGGGGSLPQGTGSTPHVQNVAVAFSIAIPKAVARVPQYISAATQSAQITVTPTGGAALTPVNVNCTATCSGTVQAPVGSDNFAVTLFDQPNAAGHQLSTGNATQTINAGVANTVTLTFGGIVAKIGIALGASSVSGTGSTTVTVTATDAANATIVGSDPYNNPITLSDTDASGGTSLSTTSVTSPATAVTLNYTPTFTSAVIGASASGVSASAVTTATLTKAAAVAAAFMTQTSATKTSATIPAGATSGVAVAISGVGDQNGVAALNTAAVKFGTGTMATSVGRKPLGASHGSWSHPIGAVDRPPDVEQIHKLLTEVPRSNLPRTRALQGVLPGSLVVGATANIWVSGSSPISVPSTLEYNSTHGHIWIDNSLISGGSAVASFNSTNLAATVAQIGADFDNAYTSDTSHYGTVDYTTSAPAFSVTNYGTCDSSGNPVGTSVGTIAEPADKMIDVMVLNPAPLGGFGGYFSSGNYVPQAVFNCLLPSQHVYSNEAPFIFVGWFDNLGANYVLQEDLVRGTAHELQHLLNYVNHSILAPGASSGTFSGSEDTFINEGMSMLSQDFAVHLFRSSETFDADDALYNADYYIQHPEDVALTAHFGKDTPTGAASSGCHACYGGDYLFARYMYDRFGGDTYIKGLTSSGVTGFPNLVQNATGSGETANQLLADFGVAMAVNGAGVTPPSTAFNLGTLSLSGTYPGLSAPTTLSGLGYAAAAIGANGTATVNAPLGGYAFLQLNSIPGAGEPVTINDTSTGGTFSLIGGLAQH